LICLAAAKTAFRLAVMLNVEALGPVFKDLISMVFGATAFISLLQEKKNEARGKRNKKAQILKNCNDELRS
jgi:hypothetical protein